MENYVEDAEMYSLTPMSTWERLNPNDNPVDRFNCFITTAAGLLRINSLKDFEIKPNLPQFVKEALLANKGLNIDRKRGAYLYEVILFYKDLGIRYVHDFSTDYDLMNYFDNDVKKGQKKKYALGFRYDEAMKKQIVATIDKKVEFEALGHIVAVKIDKSAEKHVFRLIDFQLHTSSENNQSNRIGVSKYIRLHNDEERKQFFSYARPPFDLFEKNTYQH